MIKSIKEDDYTIDETNEENKANNSDDINDNKINIKKL